VAPGEFIWANGPQTTPWSPQIFEEELNDTTMLDAFRPIEGTNNNRRLLRNHYR
jgi:hypothetical protein